MLARILRSPITVRPIARLSPVASHVRNLHVSRACWNANPDQDPLKNIENSEAYQKIMQSPELLEKFRDIAMYLQSNELVKPGQPPSVFQVAKILSNREARDKLTAFATAAQQAGIDFKSEEYV